MTSVAVALAILMLRLLLRMIFRRTGIAVAIFLLLGAVLGALQFVGLFGPSTAPLGIALQLTGFILVAIALLRFGLVVLVVSTIFSSLSNLSLLTFDTAAPFYSLGLFVTAVAFALAIYGWRTSLAGRSLMQDDLVQA